MIARDEMSALLTHSGPAFQGLDKWYLDAITTLAKEPETAPTVFRWLMEAGVVQQVGWARRNRNQFDAIVPWFFYPLDGGEPIPGAVDIYAAGDA